MEILADEDVVAESRTFAELGEVIVDWFPQVGPPGALQEDLFEEDPEDEPSQRSTRRKAIVARAGCWSAGPECNVFGLSLVQCMT